MAIEYATADNFRYATTEQLRPIIQVLTKVEWPCSAEAIPGLIDQLGWVFMSDRVNVHADTGLALNSRMGSFSRTHGEFREVNFSVSDVVRRQDAQAMAAVKDAFPLALQSFEAILGPVFGTSDEFGGPRVWWELRTGGRIRLSSIGICLEAYLLSKTDADTERFAETHDMSEYEGYKDDDE